MGVNGGLIVAGVGVGTAAAVTTGATVHFNRAARQADDRTNLADATVRRTTGVLAAAGAIGFVGGGIAMVTGRRNAAVAGAGLLAATTGFGTMFGAAASNIIYHLRHGSTVEANVSEVLRAYDHNRNGRLDLDKRRWFERSETHRTAEICRDVPDSRFDDCDTYTYSIETLVRTANTNHDAVVTRGELTRFIGRFDTEPRDGRLTGSEAHAFDRAAGERLVSRW